MEDYLVKYVTPAGFDVPRLINHDSWAAIKLLFNAGHYISASKLLLSFVDSMAYIDSGESGGPAFRRWLDAYVDLKSLEITSEELWEHRNSLLHMTNLESRRVVAGKVRQLVAYMGNLPSEFPIDKERVKPFNLVALIQAIAKGCGPFIETLNSNPSRIEVFIERYDRVVSDVRYDHFVVGNAGITSG